MTTEILLMRQDTQPLTESERRTFWSLLMRMADGASDPDRRAWRGLWSTIRNMEPGEMTALRVHVDRLPQTHRRHFALEQDFFQAQEAFEHFGAFRDWTKIGAYFVEWQGEEGKAVPVPKSINWTDVDELTMREVHLAIVAFLRKPESAVKLWPHLTDRARTEMVEGLLRGYGE